MLLGEEALREGKIFRGAWRVRVLEALSPPQAPPPPGWRQRRPAIVEGAALRGRKQREPPLLRVAVLTLVVTLNLASGRTAVAARMTRRVLVHSPTALLCRRRRLRMRFDVRRARSRGG